MTIIKRNTGGDIALDLEFYGPPGDTGTLGPEFDLTAWTVNLLSAPYLIEHKAVITVTDRVGGKARVLLEGAGALPAGTYPFRAQIARISDDFRVGFPSVRLQIGDFSVEDFDGEPPYLLLSGKDGVQLTIAPAEPEIIFGVAPSNVVTHLGQVVTNGGAPVTHAA